MGAVCVKAAASSYRQVLKVNESRRISLLYPSTVASFDFSLSRRAWKYLATFGDGLAHGRPDATRGHDQSPHHLYFFYSSRRPEAAGFLELLSEATKRNPNFHLIATVTEVDKSHREWKGETGYINKDMLTKHLSSLQRPVYYLAGPPRWLRQCDAC
jgi:hypothetical protein